MALGTSAESSRWERRHHAAFLLLVAGSLAVWWRPLASTLRLALESEAHTHILLVLPLSGALIYAQRKTIPHPSRRSVGAGVAVLIVALLIGAWSSWGASNLPDDVRLSLSVFALVIWWMGSVLFCFGARTFHSLVFPLCFLFWIVPLPEIVLNAIIQFLQHESALAARLLFRAVGTPVTQDGNMLSIPGLDIEVARECSSIRSSLMLVLTTMFMAQLLLRSWWRKGLLIAAAVPLSVAKNGLRILVISELGTRVDPAFLDGKLHHHGGIIFFAVSVAAVTALLWILQRTENPRLQELRVAK
jgi:exosortase